MKAFLLLAIAALILCSCNTPPTPVHTSLFRAEVAGYTWKKDGSAQAVFSLAVLGRAKVPLYLEAELPSPSGKPGDKVRKNLSAGEATVSFEGPWGVGWKSGNVYMFRLLAYSDAAYTQQIDSLEQLSLCRKPPDDLLKQLKD